MSQTIIGQQKSKRQMVFEALDSLGESTPKQIQASIWKTNKDLVKLGTITVYRGEWRVRQNKKFLGQLPSLESLKTTHKALGSVGLKDIPENLVRFLEAVSSNGHTPALSELIRSLKVLREIQS